MACSGKTAVVTGAAAGIGRAVAEALLGNGAKGKAKDFKQVIGPEPSLVPFMSMEETCFQTFFDVAILDVNETAGESLVEELNKQHGSGRTLFVKCDVESEEQIKAAFQKSAEAFGKIDILCNNAGIMNESAWEKTVSINLMGVIRGTYVALEHMNKLSGGQGGVIINIASMAGIGPLLTCPVYTATKSGVVGFTRAMAAASEASGYGIRFNALCPGFVQTDLLADVTTKLGRFSHLADKAQQLVENIGVLNVPEVAECFLELVKDDTKNGKALVVSLKGKTYVKFPSFT